jgi:hypothetical protein
VSRTSTPLLFEAATWQRAVTGIMNEFVVGGHVQLITAWVHHKVEELCQNCGCQGDVVDCEISPPELKRKRGRQPNAARRAQNVWYMCKRRALVAVGHLCCILLVFCH